MKKFNFVEGMPELKQLEVDESTGERFYISPKGVKLPSVTTVLGHFKKKSLIEWRNRVGNEQADAVMNRASTRGTKFHNMMEGYLRNEENFLDGVMPDMKQSFRDMQETLDLIDNIRYIESPLYSEKLGVAGRTDVIAEFGKTLSIIDFKTSTKQKKEQWIENYFEQGTAYALMYEELVGEPIDQVVILIATDDSDRPQVFIRDKNQYIENLLEKIHLYKQEKL
jgi:CRISPR/Cas system-associated exonuclease Cas4 (RecB family)